MNNYFCTVLLGFQNYLKLKLFKLKYSQIAGVIIAFLVIGVCFLPWSFVAEHQLLISGMSSKGTDFGKPGLMNIFFSGIMILLFCIQKIWAKRTNLFIGAINFAWSVRNYLLVTTCYFGECPEKKIGLFALLIFAFGAMIMTFFPKIKISED